LVLKRGGRGWGVGGVEGWRGMRGGLTKVNFWYFHLFGVRVMDGESWMGKGVGTYISMELL
jgi:hypothetical protein